MKKTKIISHKNLPIRPFDWIELGCIAYLMYDKFNVSDIATTIALTCIAIIFIGSIIVKKDEEQIDIFDKTNNKE